MQDKEAGRIKNKRRPLLTKLQSKKRIQEKKLKSRRAI